MEDIRKFLQDERVPIDIRASLFNPEELCQKLNNMGGTQHIVRHWMLMRQPRQTEQRKLTISEITHLQPTFGNKLVSITLDISPVDQSVKDYYKFVTKTYGINMTKVEFDDEIKKLNYRVKDSKWTK